MKVYKFKIRKNWEQASNFYPFNKWDIKHQKESYHTKSYDIFTEAALAIDSPFGYMIDLGWYGEYKKCVLVGMIVINHGWDNPIEKVTLKTFKEAIDWVNKWIKKIEKIEDNMTKEEKKKKMEELKRKFEEINR